MKILKEAAPAGSLERIREDLQKAFKVANIPVLGESPWIRYVFPAHVIADSMGKTWSIPYSIVNNAVTIGTPAEMEDSFVLKESGVTVGKGIAKESDIDLEYVSLKESSYNEGAGEVEVILIEAGYNEAKRRLYPESTLKESVHVFNSMKNYLNHPTKTEERERPERSLKDWVSTIKECRYENGRVMAVVAVHDPWLRGMLKESSFRENVGLSIYTGGKLSVGKKGGKEIHIVESISPVRKDGQVGSVDWVTEPGARGRVSQLLKESRTTEGTKVEILLENATIVNLKETRKDLVESISKEATAAKDTEISTLKESLRVVTDKVAKFEADGKLATQKAAVEAQLKESKASDVVKDRVREAFSANVFEGNLKEAVASKLQSELDYAAKLSGKGKIKMGSNADVNLQESVQNDLDTRAGVAVKKEEGK